MGFGALRRFVWDGGMWDGLRGEPGVDRSLVTAQPVLDLQACYSASSPTPHPPRLIPHPSHASYRDVS